MATLKRRRYHPRSSQRLNASVRRSPRTSVKIYVEHVVIPFFLTSFYEGERPLLPMIDVNFSKENALPSDLWGLIYEAWQPTPLKASLSSYRVSKSAVTTIYASGFISRR